MAGAVASLREWTQEMEGVAAGAGWWAVQQGFGGVATLPVGFLGFVSVFTDVAARAGVERELREE